MMIVRALFLASLVGGLALVACGGAGSGGTPTPANPALGTNRPATSPSPSGNPYSEPGY